MKRFFLYCLLGIFLLGNAPKEKFPRLLFFYSQSCHACHKVKQEVLPSIEKEFFDKIIIEYLDIADIRNYQRLLYIEEKYKYPKDLTTPAIFLEGEILVGYDKIRDNLKKTALLVLATKQSRPLDKLPGIDLAKRFLSFGLLAIILAGLVDGINPCAFTVIVFFISFLALQGYRKKELLAIGLSFIAAVFLTYVAIGLGVFRFLYALNKFYLISKIVYYAIAAFSFILGIFALYDLWVFKKTKKTEGLVLQLPQVLKKHIHSVIASQYRRTKTENLVLTAFGTGFLVSLLEAVCTGQLYLPTITFMLKDPTLRLRAFGYLIVYNLMFITPLLIIFLFALKGATSESFSKFLRAHLATVKLAMGILFIGLGAIILFSA
jgi:cytochrome c biogenesis protein CcdA/glutaredoxin